MTQPVSLLFLTQSRGLALFYDVACAMRRQAGVRNLGFYVADQEFWNRFGQERPDFARDNVSVLKEWDIVRRSDGLQPDIAKLRAYEQRLGDPVLWSALISDRRITGGGRITLEQDYPARFSHDRMLAILQVAIEEMEALYDRVRPDAVVNFISTTIGDYVGWLVARQRGIPFMNLRPTRIRNYFYAGETITEPSERLETLWRSLRRAPLNKALASEADQLLNSIRASHAMYEGVLPAARRKEPAPPSVRAGRMALLPRVWRNMRRIYGQRVGPVSHDTHSIDLAWQIWFKSIGRRARWARIDRSLRPQYVTGSQLGSFDYAFYPLHKEPEVTLLVYGTPYLNQIEAVRNFARSLPVGMKLLVKEHPSSLGYRRLPYYRKLLAIPNVILAAPELTSREILGHARLVTIIGGSVGLEALMLGRPVVALGRTPFSFLPREMIRTAADLGRLPNEIAELLSSHAHDEQAIRTYIAAIISSSVPVDFYSVLLGRTGVYRPGSSSADDYDRQIERLAGYLLAPLTEGSGVARERTA